LGSRMVGFLARSVLLCESCGAIVFPFPIKPISAALKVWTNLRRLIINYVGVDNEHNPNRERSSS
jgi:hypothetical protein